MQALVECAKAHHVRKRVLNLWTTSVLIYHLCPLNTISYCTNSVQLQKTHLFANNKYFYMSTPVTWNYCFWPVEDASLEEDVGVMGLKRVLNCNWNTIGIYSSWFCSETMCATLHAGLYFLKFHAPMIPRVRQCTWSQSKINCNIFRQWSNQIYLTLTPQARVIDTS